MLAVAPLSARTATLVRTHTDLTDALRPRETQTHQLDLGAHRIGIELPPRVAHDDHHDRVAHCSPTGQSWDPVCEAQRVCHGSPVSGSSSSLRARDMSGPV